jgi:hypothetical protein
VLLFLIGALGNKLIPCINDYGPAVTQRGNLLLAVYATPQHRNGFFSRLIKNNMTYMTWPRHYFEAEVRQSSTGTCAPPSTTCPGVMVVPASQEGIKIDSATNSLLHNAPVTGKEKGAWWFGLRDSCYVGVYCSHETTEVFSEEKGFPKMQMFAEDPKNLLPRRVCSQLNHAWVVAVGDTSTYPTFVEFIEYCKTISVHVKKSGSTSFTAKVTDSNWILSTTVVI